MSPLQNRVDIGQEAYVVFVADGEGGVGDLHAVRTAGGSIYPLTYTRLEETHPALSPDGLVVAFLRRRATTDSAPTDVVIMNLLNGAERILVNATADRVPTRLGWSRDGLSLYIRTPKGTMQSSVPPARPALSDVAAGDAMADSALSVYLGSPAFARVTTCRVVQEGLCVRSADGQEQPLVADARDALRWGADSVGYLVGDALVVRPLGGGTEREVRWVDLPASPRQPTVFMGPVGR